MQKYANKRSNLQLLHCIIQNIHDCISMWKNQLCQKIQWCQKCIHKPKWRINLQNDAKKPHIYPNSWVMVKASLSPLSSMMPHKGDKKTHTEAKWRINLQNDANKRTYIVCPNSWVMVKAALSPLSSMVLHKGDKKTHTEAKWRINLQNEANKRTYVLIRGRWL